MTQIRKQISARNFTKIIGSVKFLGWSNLSNAVFLPRFQIPNNFGNILIIMLSHEQTLLLVNQPPIIRTHRNSVLNLRQTSLGHEHFPSTMRFSKVLDIYLAGSAISEPVCGYTVNNVSACFLL